MMQRTHYEILGVQVDSTQDDIKAAYKRLSWKTHPDRNPGDKKRESQFKLVQQAWQILGDAEKRSAYDREQQAARRATVPVQPATSIVVRPVPPDDGSDWMRALLVSFGAMGFGALIAYLSGGNARTPSGRSQGAPPFGGGTSDNRLQGIPGFAPSYGGERHEPARARRRWDPSAQRYRGADGRFRAG